MQHFINWLVLCTYFILSWSVTCIAFKFCCILLHAVLTTNKDHTPSQFQTTDWFRSKSVPNHLKSRQDVLFLRAFQEPNTYYLIRIWYRSRKKLTYPELRSTKTSTVEANGTYRIHLRDLSQPCAYRTRLGAFTKVILPDLSTLTVAALRQIAKPP